MLPTSGYFRGISCPDHDKDYCHRPYCHFRHFPKKELKKSAPSQSSTSTTEVAVDQTDNAREASQDLPTCSTTAMLIECGSSKQQPEDDEGQEGPSGPNNEDQSELIQQLVSEAVKKVLAENPVLASSGVDPSSIVKNIDTSALVAQATAETTQANARGKKKYYFRPPDTPSYNPTPIEELNKRKRSVDYSEDMLGSQKKVVKYTPTPVTSRSTIVDATEIEPDSKESLEGEVTDFSSVESEDDTDKRKCDFDILEEVLAEHLQNNKVKVKKKRVKALGKLQYSLSMPEKKVDESSMISDARNLSDQDSNTCDVPIPRTNSIDSKLPTDGSYFLPPSPVFTTYSDAFGTFDSIVYTKASRSPDECESNDNRTLIETTKVQSSNENSDAEERSPPAVKKSDLPVKTDKRSTNREDSKKKTQGHTHLPQVVHTLVAPKLSRPNVRIWTPQVRSNMPGARKEGDALEEMLQLMDGKDAIGKADKKESSKHSGSRTGHQAASAKKKEKYKVDLDKEIESLTNSSAAKKGEPATSDTVASPTENSGAATEVWTSPDGVAEEGDTDQVPKEKTNKENKENDINKKTDLKEGKNTPSDASGTEVDEESKDDDSVDDDKSTEDSTDDSQTERGRRKRKRKRSYSDSSDSDRSLHRKKRKKSRKRKRKHSRSKKRRKHKESRSESSDSDEDSVKDDNKDDGGDDKSETNGETHKDDEIEKPKKHKKHRKKNKHRKKSKHKRKKRKASKSKKRGSKSRSSSRNRSRSSSKHKSRSSSKHRSRSSSKDRSRSSSKDKSSSSSKDRSRSTSKDRSRSSSRHRSRSSSRGRSRSSSKARSRNSSKDRSRNSSKDSTRNSSKDRSRNSSKQRSRSSSKNRSRVSSKDKIRSSSKHRSRSLSENRSQSPNKGQGESSRKRSRSRSRSKNSSISKPQHRRDSVTKTHIDNKAPPKDSVNFENIQTITTPMPIDPSKIKVEKDILVPNLSIVKIEKMDDEKSSSAHSKKVEKKNISEGSEKSNDGNYKNVHSICQKSSVDAAKDSENIKKKEKEQARLSNDRESKRRDSRDRKNSTESNTEKMPASSRRCSTDSKKSDKEIILEKKKVLERTSVDKNKKDKILSPTADLQPKGMSMFDMVLASTQPAKSKSLTEISIFDAVSNMKTQDVSTDSSGVHTDDDDVSHRNFNDSDTQDNSTEISSQRKRTLSQSSTKSKSESGSKTGKLSDQHRSTSNLSSKLSRRLSSSSSKDAKRDSKHAHSSSSKQKSTDHHSSSNHSGSSSHQKISDSGSISSKQQHSSIISSNSVGNKYMSVKNNLPSTSKRKESKSDNTSSHSSSSSIKHYPSSKKSSSISSSKHSSGSRHKDKGHSRAEYPKNKEESKPIEVITISPQTSVPESSSDGISDRDLYACNDNTGNESPLPDLSMLEEIPQDDWEQMINSSDKVDLKHLENLRTFEDSDQDEFDRDDPEVMEQCLKMFNEYEAPEEPDVQPVCKKARTQSVDEEPDALPGKSRVARSSSSGNLIPKKTSFGQQRKKTPAQIMMERYQKLKEQKAKLMEQVKKQKKQLEEQNRSVSTSQAKATVSQASPSSSLMSPPHSSSGGLKRRISHVPNVSSLLHARERIKNLPPTNSRSLLSPSVAKASGVIPQTTAQTTTKGSKRIAHTPKAETLKRPVIPAEFGSKVPHNIRQRYLNSIIDECLKFCGEREAFKIGAAEERVCFKRASSRMVYLNLAVNAVKRLRTQREVGEAAQELLDNDPQFVDSLHLEEVSPGVKPSTSGASSSQSKAIKPHPVNPNHVRLSHFTVLSGGGQRGSWSIEKPKKNTSDIQDSLKGEAFYKLLAKYILTEEELAANGFPLPDPEEKGKAIIKSVDTRKKISPSSIERYCDRCNILYKVDKWGFPTSTAPCIHHWGRANKRRTYSGFEARYTCCGGDQESEGCCQATTHVSQNYDPCNLRGFVRTLPKDTTGGDPGVYALDCEMCYTTAGNELTRITIINTEGNTIYEQLVKPDNPIIDYNTRFSGITESDMEDVKTTIRDVQAAILTRFSDKSILIGHSLESDFHALKLIHDTVVDTSTVFPHKMGPPFKRALRNLASEYLKTIIQNDVSGHDSAEDALTCMRLMKWRVKEDLKGIK
ncbi:serine-rich adhesin for platelets-like isoform X2 [Homarus americanus]|uniref:serine-rich adhesin for platelets-like isoform X2 n=1 Tax=Homarus americanus TaxID=6706 RepID=UPI001C456C3C|nr:serine-rich adhesin for platelets-like isoform X2 [Homarus americanus]